LSSYIAFYKICGNNFSAAIGAASYVFSSVFYNYFSMGWIWILLFMAFLPVIVLLVRDYYNSNNNRPLLIVGLLTSMLFAQSQAIVWVPLVFFVYAFSFWIYSHHSLQLIIYRTISAIFIVMFIVFIVHMSWIIPLLFNSESIQVLGNNAFHDFNISNITNSSELIRGWGNLVNKNFDHAFDSNFLIFSFFAPMVLFGLLLMEHKNKQTAIFALILMLIPFLIHVSSFILLELPFTNIIRDTNRFVVLANFGFALAVSLFFTKIISIKIRGLGLIVLLFSIHPFLNGSLFTWDPTATMNNSVRFLDVPQIEIEGVLKKFDKAKNILFPTGGAIGTSRDERFSQPYSETPDFDAQFSTYASGIYASNKSSPLVANFASNYIEAGISNGEQVTLLSRLYGIDNIFIRNDLFSSYDREFNSQNINIPGCYETSFNSSAWSISKICEINNPYPLIYIPNKIIKSDEKKLVEILDVSGMDIRSRMVAIGCPENISFSDEIICSENDLSYLQNLTPAVRFSRIETTRFNVTITGITGNYLLVLNQTFHSGWVIKDMSSNEVKSYQKKLINHLVNGWLITPENRTTNQSFIIEFSPQKNYIFLRNMSLTVFFGLIVLVFFLYFRNKGRSIG
jgi:hypothetical protein